MFTSNAPPAELYRDGLQRSRFLPAIALIERCTETVNVDAGLDYRLRQLERAPLYLDALDPFADECARAALRGDRGGSRRARRRTRGRGTRDPRAPPRQPMSSGSTSRRCAPGRAAPSDYVEIARDFHTVFVSGIPVLEDGDNDPARRFIALVDEFYDRNVKLVVSAAAAPEVLYRGERLAFEFERTRSRLVEMQTREYLARPHLA